MCCATAPDDARPRIGDRPRTEPSRIAPRIRYAAGEAWDELGGLPEDLDAWVLCPKCADSGDDLLGSKYPVTNFQFERFVEDKGYINAGYWGGEKGPGWQWREAGKRRHHRWNSDATGILERPAVRQGPARLPRGRRLVV